MDSLKIPKGGSQNSSPNNAKQTSPSVPIAVRFNANAERIDDIFNQPPNQTNIIAEGGNNVNTGGGGGGDSLSSSPSQPPQQHSPQPAQSQNVDDANTRNFLQGNFFNRKRSGSIEGVSPTSASPNLIAALSSGETTSVGTWRLIKGKVSQTIEEIKSSKSGSGSTNNPSTSQNVPVIQHTRGAEQTQDPDSDVETPTVNTSISEELPLDQEHFKHTQPPHQKGDSDSEFEGEILLEADVERSRLRRGLDNLKSKVKAKSAAAHQRANTMNRDTSPTAKPAASSVSLRSTFLRKRRRQPDTAEIASAAETTAATANVTPSVSTQPVKSKVKGIVPGKKEVEIESGIEMLEDMIPPASQADDNRKKKETRERMDLPIEGGSSALHVVDGQLSGEAFQDCASLTMFPKLAPSSVSVKSVWQLNDLFTFKYIPPFILLCLLLTIILPIPEFLRGILVCLFSLGLMESLWTAVQCVIGKFLITHPPEKSKFRIPDYASMAILEIPAVEEHKTVKTYEGWMNEVNSYDPDNFHISMSKSVFIKIDGTILRISTTTARIPKKVMWNEAPIDRKSITFTSHRTYNLLGCRIELLPLGLARKRYFNRKYPIQLIIKDCESFDDVAAYTAEVSKRPSSSSIRDENEYTFLDVRESRHSLLNLPQTSNTTQQSQLSSNEMVDLNSERSFPLEPDSEMDFANTIMNADLQTLQETLNTDEELKEFSVPCGDEVRLILFSRGDREKEDWYRRFVAASTGKVHDQEDLHLQNIRLVDDADLQAAAARAHLLLVDPSYRDPARSSPPTAPNDNDDARASTVSAVTPVTNEERRSTFVSVENGDDNELDTDADPNADVMFEGLLISANAARNPPDYIRFMALYQQACNQTHVPVHKKPKELEKTDDKKKQRRNRRIKRHEDELWKGIDQSLFLGPSGSVVWANVLVGRVLFSCLHDAVLNVKIKDFLQKKINSLKLPSFMEEVTITNIYLGEMPPLIHRVSQPVLDERGTWLDADITYEGFSHITVTTKLNLLRLKRQARQPLVLDVPTTSGAAPGGVPSTGTTSTPVATMPPMNALPEDASPQTERMLDVISSSSAIFDSDAESVGGSSSEAESISAGTEGEPQPTDNKDFNVFNTSPGNARRIFKIVDRITASNFFQYATELSYVQRAMENMNANITLRVDLKGLVARGTMNIPPPPSDRVWLSFRGPPRLWISAKPTVGDKSVDWSIVTNVIESKICEEVNKFLVFPNMVDLTIPFLGQPTYQE